MKPEALHVYRCPSCRGDLVSAGRITDEIIEGVVTCASCGLRWSVRQGIFHGLDQNAVTGPDLKFQRIYNHLSRIYDPLIHLGSAVLFGGDIALRGEFAHLLELHPGDRVLEISVGTGGNLPYIGSFTAGLDLYGLDLSAGSLERCRKNLTRWHLDAELCLANADRLPFGDESFACVYHKGGINGFTRREQALAEMFRVARPGSRIVVSDETADMFYTRRQFKRLGMPEFADLTAPVDLLPPEAEDVQVTHIGRGMFYVLTFRKPRTRPHVAMQISQSYAD